MCEKENKKVCISIWYSVFFVAHCVIFRVAGLQRSSEHWVLDLITEVIKSNWH